MPQAVVLAGASGLALGDTAEQAPLAMREVAGRPFIDHLAWNLRRHGVERIVVSAGRFGAQLAEHVGDGSAWGVSAEVVFEDEPLGSGGGALRAASLLDADEFLLLTADALFDVNYLDLLLRRRVADAPIAVALRACDEAGRHGSARMEGDRITGFLEGAQPDCELEGGGVYACSRSALADAPEGAFSFERDLLPSLAGQGRLVGSAYDADYIDIAESGSLVLADERVAKWRDKPMVLLDRDGVLNEDRGWVHSPAEFAWLPGAVRAVKWLNDRGCLAVVVTNQSGIARGYYTEEEYLGFERWIAEQLAQHGAHLDAVYHCPHHPTEGVGELTRQCDCRKPAAGLVLQALADFGTSPQRAVLVGDKDSDMQAAEAAEVRALRYEGQDLVSLVQHAGVC